MNGMTNAFFVASSVSIESRCFSIFVARLFSRSAISDMVLNPFLVAWPGISGHGREPAGMRLMNASTVPG
ncbi:hypothetical protein GCM10022230_10320 [Pseudoclavibacter caeni]